MTHLLPGQLVRLSSRGLQLLNTTNNGQLQFYIVPEYKSLYSVCAADIGMIIQPRVYKKLNEYSVLEWLVLYGETRIAIYDYLLESADV